MIAKIRMVGLGIGTKAKQTMVPYTPATTTMNPTAAPTATPKTPAFEAIFAI